MLFSFQGKVWAGNRLANGKLSKPVWGGNVDSMTLNLSSETSTVKESFSGKRLPYGRMSKGVDATLNIVWKEALPQNVALAVWATELDVSGSTVSAEVFEAGLVAGDFVKLDHPFVASVVLTDSATEPATLEAGTNYRVDSANGGLIEILTPGSLTQPFKAAYSYAARSSFAMFTAAPPERYLMLDGINTETNEPVVVLLYRCKFDPVSDLALINEDYGTLPMTASVLYDVVNAADANLGGFGRIDIKPAV